jgi:hypothetical protein
MAYIFSPLVRLNAVTLPYTAGKGGLSPNADPTITISFHTIGGPGVL